MVDALAVRALASSRGLHNIAAIARAARVKRRTVRDLLQGRRRPRKRTLRLVAEALSVSPATLEAMLGRRDP